MKRGLEEEEEDIERDTPALNRPGARQRKEPPTDSHLAPWQAFTIPKNATAENSSTSTVSKEAQGDRVYLQYDADSSTIEVASLGELTDYGSGFASSEDYVCYGMISAVNCQRLPSAQTYDARDLENGLVADRYILLAANLTPEAYTISDRHGSKLFVVNKKLVALINDAATSCSLYLEPYADQESLSQVWTQKQAAKGGKVTVRLNLNVYGRMTMLRQAGQLLSDSGIFLQRPLWSAPGIVYSNPQLIFFPKLAKADVWVENLLIGCAESAQSSVGDWTVVLDDLPLYHDALEMQNKHLMRTALFSHQLEACTYMHKREVGSLAENMQLWTLESGEDGVPVYRHTITGATSHERPCEPRSGLLADHMGLGKTLSTISLIVSSLERARSHLNKVAPVQIRQFPRKATSATLVVVPSVLLMEEWNREIQRLVNMIQTKPQNTELTYNRHTVPDALKVARYHGHQRAKNFIDLQDFDVVLTTFGTVTTEFRKTYRRGREVLYYLHWFRIVLDEAHTIRSRTTKQFEAVSELEAQHYWCLTGTPVSNKIEDIAALLQICRVPFLGQPQYFRDYVSKPAKRSFPQGCRILRQLLSPLCLRRTKALLNIPLPCMVQYTIRMPEPERQRYRKLEDYHRRKIDETVSRLDKQNLRNAILPAILDLRIHCNQGHSSRVLFHDEKHLDPDEALALLEEQNEALCASCSSEVPLINALDDPGSGILGICMHMLCASCLEIHRSADSSPQRFHCPACKVSSAAQELSYDQVEAAENGSANATDSAKLKRLVEDLLNYQEKEKSIVFSFWKKTLDLAAALCQKASIKHARVDGSVPHVDRSAALKTFATDPGTTVLLMTLGTGALGLNLTAASRIHILEPQWNPAVEDQAIGRAVRIGQEQNATIIRYIVEDSVEQHIQTYQQRKRRLVAGGFGDKLGDPEVEHKLLTATFFGNDDGISS